MTYFKCSMLLFMRGAFFVFCGGARAVYDPGYMQLLSAYQCCLLMIGEKLGQGIKENARK